MDPPRRGNGLLPRNPKQRYPWIVCLWPLQGDACRVFGWQSCIAHGFGTYPHNYSAPGPPPSAIAGREP